MDPSATVYLIDDDPAILRLMTRVLTHEGYRVECFPSGEAFLSREDLSNVGCVIADLFLPGIQGAAIQSHLLQINSPLALIVISGQADVAAAVQLMKSGAITLLQKPISPDELLSAVAEGLTRNSHQLAQRIHLQGLKSRLADLTEDEKEVLRCMMRGLSRKEIATTLILSPRTLDRRQQSLLKKMNVESVPELIAVFLTKTPEGELI